MFIRAADQNRVPSQAGKLLAGVAFCLMAALSMPASCALAQTAVASKTSGSAPAAKSPAAAASSSKPAWQDLTPVQQVSLKPLAANWNTLGISQKRKWIVLAQNYPRLAPTEQLKLHSRMTEWVSLSQQQRAQARLNFAQAKQLSPDEKAATWKAYQELSPEEKQRLATSAVNKPVGAAAAAKPVPAQKLAAVPVTRHSPKAAPKIAASDHALNHNTLLPQTQPALEPVTPQKN
ncbi:MAG: DUF3106 domain-containing protein [Comamonadaceae bacterium]